ncbi:MAG: SDR family oxidoreductase [Anaerolineales bacterium]
MNFEGSLTGRKALVTGAGKRLGKAFALGLAEAGCEIVVHYHTSEDAAQDTVSKIQGFGRRALTLQGDLSEAESSQQLVSQSIDALGDLDILINSASIFQPVDAQSTTLEVWEQNLDVNLRAPVFLAQALAKHIEGREGDVVNLLDWRAFRPGADHFAYTIAKAGLAAATKSLAQAYAPSLRVNGLALGAILPPPGAEGGKQDSVIEPVPAKRWGTVEEAVDALLFLVAGPRYITGEITYLDGGRHLV